MAYAQDTLISANAANAYVTVLKGLLIDAGWTLEDSGVPSTTYAYEVYKSDGTLNDCGYDWYLSIQWNTVGTEQTVDIIGGAAWDDATKRISLIPAAMQGNDYSSFGVADRYASAGDGDLWGPVLVNAATNTLSTVTSTIKGGVDGTYAKGWHSTIIPSSAFACWMSVTLDHVAVFTTVPNAYVVGTLDVDPAWLTQTFDVCESPLFSARRNTPSAGTNPASDGINAGPFGTGAVTANYIAPTFSREPNYGAPLPILEGNYLDAVAWRPRFYMTGLSGASNAAPTFDSPQFAGGLVIGDAIDLYAVTSGSIGDTVEIESATYVLTGPIAGSGSLATVYALLVE